MKRGRKSAAELAALAARQPDLRSPWQIDQAARCGCKGTNDMCACQNEEAPWRYGHGLKPPESGSHRAGEPREDAQRRATPDLAPIKPLAEGELREVVARLIDPGAWRVMDGYLADVKRKYKDENAGYDPASFKHKGSLAIADAILALLSTQPPAVVPPAEEVLKAFQQDAGIPFPPTPLTHEFRLAIAGQGPRAYDWADKPHRLVYDLCRVLEELAAKDTKPSRPDQGEAGKVYVNVSGLTGSGKSAVYIELVVALQALGLTVEHAKPDEWRTESGLLSADGNNLQDFKPTIVLSETNIPREPS